MSPCRPALVIFALLWATACRSVGGLGPPAARPLHEADPRGSWHVVEEGETWAALAARKGVPLEDLLEINGVPRAGPLAPGQAIYLLEPERGAPPTGGGAPSDGTWRWPVFRPVVSSRFGTLASRVHEGIDLAATIGTPIEAARDGFVLYAGDGVRGYGNMVVLQHQGDWLSVYAHASLLLVKTGDRVDRGQEIARVGQSGRATAPHLHFEIREGEVPRDPMAYLPPLKETR